MYLSNSSPFATFISERTFDTNYTRSKLRFSVFNVLSIYFENTLVVEDIIPKSTIDRIIVSKKTRHMTLLRRIRFFGVFLSVKVFLKSFMILLKDIELEVAEETLDIDC